MAKARRPLEPDAPAATAERLRRQLARQNGSRPGSLDLRMRLAQALARAGRPDEAEAELRAILETAPGEADVHACLGQVVARAGRRVQAVAHLERAAALAPRHWAAAELTRLKGEIARAVHAWHLPMLADTARNAAFQRAIEAAVRPDDLVLDVGTGTGLLAMMAARAGAEHVVACEMIPDLAELARIVVRQNGYAGQVAVVPKASHALVVGVDLPRPATLMVAEVFDALLIGEGALGVFRHARQHLLAPDARIIPAAATLRGQLAAMPRLKAMHPLRRLNGFDLSGFGRHGLEKQFYPVRLDAEEWQPLSEPFDLVGFDFRNVGPLDREWEVAVPATGNGVLQALVLWFDLQLDRDTSLSSGPGGEVRHWDPVVFVLDAETPVASGRTVTVRARMGGDVLFFRA